MGRLYADGGLLTPRADYRAREIKLVLIDRDGRDKGVDSVDIVIEKKES